MGAAPRFSWLAGHVLHVVHSQAAAGEVIAVRAEGNRCRACGDVGSSSGLLCYCVSDRHHQCEWGLLVLAGDGPDRFMSLADVRAAQSAGKPLVSAFTREPFPVPANPTVKELQR